ncbi:MAG: hypothetical protein HYS27_27555 [Deltaproteobacteria bacterium]|nr:hypothetical protein [Deltaproteobacteria bacterium]
MTTRLGALVTVLAFAVGCAGRAVTIDATSDAGVGGDGGGEGEGEGEGEGPGEGEGEGEGGWGGEGEGEGEPILQAYLLQDDGDGLVETPLDEGFGLAIAVSRARGVPVVFAAARSGNGFGGAVLAHVDPFGAAPTTERFDDVFASEFREVSGTVADLDLDGDQDLLVLGQRGFGVLLDEGDEFRVAESRRADLWPTSVGVVDLDEDGVLDAYLPGRNQLYWTLRVVDGVIDWSVHLGQWPVGHYGYCAASFAGGVIDGSPILLVVGDVCYADLTVTGVPTAPQRLFLLDQAMNEVASLDLGMEGNTAITLRGSSAYIAGRRFAPSPDEVGTARGTLAIEVTPTGFGAITTPAGDVPVVGSADIDGDGADSWVGCNEAPAATDFIRLPTCRERGAIGDADDDGRDEIFVATWLPY